MVIEYLRKIENELMEQLDHCENQQNEFDLQLKENKRFISLLEESEDPYYEAFSPRQINRYQKKKIHDLYQEQEEIIKNIENQKNIHNQLQKKLDEVKIVLKEALSKY